MRPSETPKDKHSYTKSEPLVAKHISRDRLTTERQMTDRKRVKGQ